MTFSEDTRIEVRPCLLSYATVSSPFLLLAIFGAIVAMKPPVFDWRFVYIPMTAGILLTIWLSAIRLQIADGRFSYRTLIGTRSIKLSEIEKAETALIGASKGTSRALVIHPFPETKQKPMKINIGAFSKKDLGRVFDGLSPVFKGPRTIGIYTDETA